MTAEHDLVKKHICLLYDELVQHDGYAELAVDIRILKRGQKEVVIRSGRQHRYVVNQAPDAGPGKQREPATSNRDGITSPA